MAQNALRVDWTAFWLTFGTAVCFVWILASVVRYRVTHRKPSMAKAPTTREGEPAVAPGAEPTPEGYLLSFNKHVEEGEGGLTTLGWVVLIGVPVWWALYLIVYWGRDLTPLPTHLLPF